MRASLQRWCRALIPFAHAQSVLIEKLTDASTPVDEVVAASNELAPLLASHVLPATKVATIVSALVARGVRHEPVLERCFWTMYKAPFPEPQLDSECVFADSTASTFCAMTRSGFVNDTQLLTLGIGRCIECAPFLSAKGLAEAYRGLEALQRGHFSLTEVGLQDSRVGANGTLRDTLDALDSSDFAALAHQPNLLDVACSALETRMSQLSSQWPQASASDRTEATPLIERLSDWVTVLRSVSQVGVTSTAALASLSTVLSRWPVHPMTAAMLTDALASALQLHERVIDVLNHDESVLFVESRDAMVASLTSSLRETSLSEYPLHRNATLVVRLRRLFENDPRLYNQAPLLWDQVRSVKVSRRGHKSSTDAISPTSRTRSGKLLQKQFAVKTKRVTSDLSGAERFVPPEFKTWRSPQHTPRGGHQHQRGTPRKVGFGTRRISKNYLRDRRRSYARK